MKILKIEVIKNKNKRANNPYCIGKITIGEFQETFHMYLDIWNLEQYKQQWKEALERIKTHDSSCLISNIYSCEEKICMHIYYLYKINNKIFVQYQLFHPIKCEALANKPLPFDLFNFKNRYKNLHKFRTHD